MTRPEEIFFATVDRAMLFQGRLRFTHDMESLILKGMSQVHRLVEMHGVPLLFIDGGWLPLEKPAAARYNAGKLLRFIAVDTTEASMDPNEWEPAGSALDAPLLAHLRGVTGIYDMCLFPDKLERIMSGMGGRGKDVRAVYGMLLHPVHGNRSNWIYNFDNRQLPDPDPGYPHLKRLFSAFPLTQPSHVTLYSYLLACFHEASLRSDRPILFVDSWKQGRGKSQICRAMSILIDGQDRAISLPRDRDGSRDEVIAHYLSGRSGYVDNIDGKRNWNHPLLASMSTGTANVRGKYNQKTTPLIGTITMLNSIYGASSYHGDMVDRFHRVELLGFSHYRDGLSPAPAVYAEEHRLEIIAEILQAHHKAKEEKPDIAYTRFKEFDLAGSRAYAEVFGAELRNALQSHLRAGDGAQSLRTEYVENLYCHRHTDFFAANERVFRGPIWSTPRKEFAPKLGPNAAGATALGYRLTICGSWRPDSEVEELLNG